MSKPINELDALQAILNKPRTLPYQADTTLKTNKQNGLATRFGGRPVLSVSGDAPTKRIGPINGVCNICGKKAAIRFNTILYCHKHYRYNLQVRKDDIWFSQHSTDPDFNLENWENYLKERDSKYGISVGTSEQH